MKRITTSRYIKPNVCESKIVLDKNKLVLYNRASGFYAPATRLSNNDCKIAVLCYAGRLGGNPHNPGNRCKPSRKRPNGLAAKLYMA